MTRSYEKKAASLVSQAVKKNFHTPTSTLAQRLYEAQPEFWISVERVRSRIRRLRSKNPARPRQSQVLSKVIVQLANTLKEGEVVPPTEVARIIERTPTYATMLMRQTPGISVFVDFGKGCPVRCLCHPDTAKP